ncbi:MAG: hypothetical protein WC702_03325 [Patescibacteria group bacterium]|jgi:hypothetical protein
MFLNPDKQSLFHQKQSVKFLKSLISRLLIFVIFFTQFYPLAQYAQAASYTNSTIWYLHATSASSAFGTTGPIAEYSAGTDGNSSTPTNKTTALSMTYTSGASAVTVTGNQADGAARQYWFRTFLSPKLAAQTIPGRTNFQLALEATESNTSSNSYLRIHVYVWREGTGYIQSLYDGIGAGTTGNTDCYPEFATSMTGKICSTDRTDAADVSINENDQIAVEVWVYANNTSSSYTASIQYDGTWVPGEAAAFNNSRGFFRTSAVLTPASSLTTVDTTWFLRDSTAAATWSTTGPIAEYSAASDNVSGSPTSKTTALAMSPTSGSSAVTVTGNQTAGSAGTQWFRTYLSPPLAAQTIPQYTWFQVGIGAGSSTSASNSAVRINMYQWREGTGMIALMHDNASAAWSCPAADLASSNLGKICSASTNAAVTLAAGDQIALEVWIYENNTSTSYTAAIGFNFNELMGGGSSPQAGFQSYLTLFRDVSRDLPPNISIAQPDGTSDAVVAGASYNITYTLADTDHAVTAAFYYDTNNTGADGVAITGPCATAAEGTGVTCAWDTTGMTAGEYYVYGIVNDGTSGDISAYSPGQITINGQPSVGTVGDTPDPVSVGSDVTFSSGTWTDANTAETVKMFVCSSDSLVSASAGGCTDTTWYASGSFTDTNPQTGAYTALAGDALTSPNSYYVFVCDSKGLSNSCSASSSGTWSATSGTLSVDIVDASGVSVGSPTLALGAATVSFDYQTTEGSLGVADQKIRVSNSSANPAWSLSIAATDGTTALWSAGTPKYDFNDPTAGAVDGGDVDSYGGQLSVNPAAEDIDPEVACTIVDFLRGSSSKFSEGVTNSITLLSAGAGADVDCYWDITAIDLSQSIPAEQVTGSYSINLTLTVTAI